MTLKPEFSASQVFTNKEEIALGVKDELTKSMTGFGYAIIQVRRPLFRAYEFQDHHNRVCQGLMP